MTILLNIFAIIIILLGIFMIVKDKEKRLDNYKPAHIADFVAFAQTQLYLPKVQAVKAIRTEFRHLELVEAVEVYELAVKEKEEKKEEMDTPDLSEKI